MGENIRLRLEGTDRWVQMRRRNGGERDSRYWYHLPKAQQPARQQAVARIVDKMRDMPHVAEMVFLQNLDETDVVGNIFQYTGMRVRASDQCLSREQFIREIESRFTWFTHFKTFPLLFYSDQGIARNPLQIFSRERLNVNEVATGIQLFDPSDEAFTNMGGQFLTKTQQEAAINNSGNAARNLLRQLRTRYGFLTPDMLTLASFLQE